MTEERIPLFPLNTVLYPGGPLSLRIFEPRYIDMVRECTSQDRSFGVCLILSGGESGDAAATVKVGTTARIVDFFTMEDGLLGIRAMGQQRFRVQRTAVRDNGLLTGDVEWLPAEPPQPYPTEHLLLRSVLERMLEQVGGLYPDHGEADLEDPSWVGYRLAELLPLELPEKQQLLELEDALERLNRLAEALPRFQVDGDDEED